MSRRTMQILIGKLIENDAFLRRFERNRAEVPAAMWATRSELTTGERESLLTLDLPTRERFTKTLDPCIRKWRLECQVGGGLDL